MTTLQIKTEIQKTLEKIPENVLGEALDYLKQLEGNTKQSILQNNNIKRIIEEDRNFLKRLAQ